MINLTNLRNAKVNKISGGNIYVKARRKLFVFNA